MHPGLIAIIILVSVAIIARLNIPIISTILRVWWNFSFTILAFIPFFGWMSHFIIARNDEEKAAKEEIVNIGSETDSKACDAAGKYAEREKARIAADQAAREAAQAARDAAEEQARADLYRATGSRDVSLNSDGTMAKVGDGEWISKNEFDKSLK